MRCFFTGFMQSRTMKFSYTLLYSSVLWIPKNPNGSNILFFWLVFCWIIYCKMNCLSEKLLSQYISFLPKLKKHFDPYNCFFVDLTIFPFEAIVKLIEPLLNLLVNWNISNSRSVKKTCTSNKFYITSLTK